MAGKPEPFADALRVWMTTAELAARWRLSPRTLERWRAQRRGPAWVRLFGRILYHRDSVEAGEREALQVARDGTCGEGR